MSPLALLATSGAAMVLVLALLALLRRITRSETSGGWITSQLATYIVGFFLTVALASTLIFLGRALMPIIGHTLYAGLLSLAAHVAVWSVMRLLVPLSRGADPSMPYKPGLAA